MGITPHNRISTKHQKRRGRAPGGCRTILNKLEGGMLYQKTRDSWMFFPRTLSTIGKQLSPTGITPTILCWILPSQDTTHNLNNLKQMSKKTDPYCKDRPGSSLPPDTCKCNNRSNIHINGRRYIISLSMVTLWYHTRTRRIYNFQ